MGSIIFVNISSRAMAVITLRQMPYTEIDDFDADLPCKGHFAVEIDRWRLKVGDHRVHQNIHGLQTKTCRQRPLSEYSYYFKMFDCSSSHVCMLRTHILGLVQT